MAESFNSGLANDLAKGWLDRNIGPLARYGRPTRGGTARIAGAVPYNYSGNRQVLSSLMRQAHAKIMKGQNVKHVASQLATSTQRLVGQTRTVAPGIAPKGYGGSGYSGGTPRAVGQAPTQGFTARPTVTPTVGVAAPTYVNPSVSNQNGPPVSGF